MSDASDPFSNLMRATPEKARSMWNEVTRKLRMSLWRGLDKPAKKNLIRHLKTGDLPVYGPYWDGEGYDFRYELTELNTRLWEDGILKEVREILKELKDEELDTLMNPVYRPEPTPLTDVKEGGTYLMDIYIDPNVRVGDVDEEGPTFTYITQQPPFFTKVKVTRVAIDEQAGAAGGVGFVDELSGQYVRIDVESRIRIYSVDEYAKKAKLETTIALQGTPADQPKGMRGLLPAELAGEVAKFAYGKGRRTRKSKSVRRKRTVSRKHK